MEDRLRFVDFENIINVLMQQCICTPIHVWPIPMS